MPQTIICLFSQADCRVWKISILAPKVKRFVFISVCIYDYAAYCTSIYIYIMIISDCWAQKQNKRKTANKSPQRIYYRYWLYSRSSKTKEDGAKESSLKFLSRWNCAEIEPFSNRSEERWQLVRVCVCVLA